SRKRAASGPFKSIENVVKRTKNTRLRVHLFDSTVGPALTYASETWSLRKQDERSLIKITRYRTRSPKDDARSIPFHTSKGWDPNLQPASTIKNQGAVLYAKQSKMRWAGHVMRMNENRWTRAVSDWIPRNVKRIAGKPPTLWSE
ncbi:hypothetical protein Angca_003024, partial [Angiostrongylus cantonensis]